MRYEGMQIKLFILKAKNYFIPVKINKMPSK